MSWFRRNKGDDATGVDEVTASTGSTDDAAEGTSGEASTGRTLSPLTDVYDRSKGPWDESEADAEETYIDLGAIRLPAKEGTIQIRLEIEEETSKVIAATVQLEDSAVQLQAFAAPRTSGIWDEIRSEISASVSRQGGEVDDVPGVFGRELLAKVPARTPDGRTVLQPARFSGVDGPRWFLRAVFHGAAALDEEKAQELERLVRDVVVVRGTEAMAPRELLPLRLPENAQSEGEEGTADQAGRPDSLRPPERGPEITELR
ncbi:DUF3710 domain-containing protein [Kineosporia sp. NBRC 101731]|uniref:DUF3710 domain-containing protein n=1 Tax=Kineosporia sp. NBRC 101731 TaxID=3032199 RepID=UPI0024A14B7E|nr:DUF3710 domain-containing protein [Kineosporia sp. NBRC 101731]GLY33280.1 hypothetical protein Kisp02_66450 [Kineosporia sp. NBRC 101731]